MTTPKQLIYLDYSATAPPLAEVIALYADRMSVDFANPSSGHRLGQDSAKRIKDAKDRLARILDCQSNEIIFTSGGSEAINTALKGLFSLGVHPLGSIASCPGEHAATRNTCAALNRQGVPILPFGLMPDGAIDLDSIAAVLTAKPKLLTFMYVNNETGALAPIEEIVLLRNRISPGTRIHLDAVQAMGKIQMSFRRTQVDFLSLSGHKFGAPKGIGLLLMRHGLSLLPLIDGGGQQNDRRSGTENAPLAEALALATEIAAANTTAEFSRIRSLNLRMQQILMSSGLPFSLVCKAPAVPHILTLLTPGLRAETLLNALSAENIMISAGSACSTGKTAANPVLKAMGFSDEAARSVIRISFGRMTTEEDVDLSAEAIIRLYRLLARR